ncbi:ERF family protein [Veillonella sp.]|nr:ERF family protein [Veillonella sp.]MBS6676116.1 ERF family protein [Veillonella sp.]
MSLESLLNELVAAKTEVERLKAEMNSSVCQERLEQEKAFNKAFAKAQAEFKSLSKSMSAEFTTKTGHLIAYSYAPMSAIKDAVMPALNRNGLAISHYEKSGNGLVSVVTVITHEGGYSREWQSPAMVYDAKDARSMRRVVSSLRRYGTLNACGIEESSSDDEHLEYVAEQAEVSQMEIGQMNDVLQGDYLVKRIRDGIEVALELGATSDQLKHWSESQPSKSVLKELSDFITATKNVN